MNEEFITPGVAEVLEATRKQMAADARQHIERDITHAVAATVPNQKRSPVTFESLAEIMAFMKRRRFVAYVVRPDVYGCIRADIEPTDIGGGWRWGLPIYSEAFQVRPAWRFHDRELMEKYLRHEITETDLERLANEDTH